jgi:hypothetical protein
MSKASSIFASSFQSFHPDDGVCTDSPKRQCIGGPCGDDGDSIPGGVATRLPPAIHLHHYVVRRHSATLPLCHFATSLPLRLTSATLCLCVEREERQALSSRSGFPESMSLSCPSCQVPRASCPVPSAMQRTPPPGYPQPWRPNVQACQQGCGVRVAQERCA